MKKVILSLLAIALVMLQAAPVPAPASLAFGPATYAARQSAAREPRVSTEHIARHINVLASDEMQGRRAGTPGADKAARYIAEQFRAFGLKPPSPSGFQQSFTFVSGVRLGKSDRFQIKAARNARSLKVGEDYMPMAFSSPDVASGRAVFAGYGISAPELQYDNYSGVDAAGKIVLIMRGSPDGDNPHGRFAEYTMPGLEIQKKTLKAREKGARGVVFISDEKDFKEDRLSRLRHDLNFLDAGIPAAVISRQVAESILSSAGTSIDQAEKRVKEKPDSFAVGNVEVEFKSDVVKIDGKGANVVGLVEGSDPQLKKEYVILGAHYDHLGLGGSESLAANPEGEIHHGADDNASGTSALMELARVIAASAEKPRRSVLFLAFSAEELGLLGSAAYTKNPLVPIESTVAMLNMDMVGRLREGALTIGGVGTSPAWKPLLDKLNGETENGASARFNLQYNQDGFGPSDHQSFYVRDIPVLFFFTGTHDDYHKPSDTADKINTEGAGRIAKLVGEIALAVANEPARIAFNRVKRESRPTGRGFRVYLGTVPNYSDQDGGLKLDGVRPESPAERAGLRAGDVIIKLGAIPIKNVYDYTFALGELTGGQEVEVVIRRDGREMTLKVTPDKRR
ncbi:MAG: M28 family peptidase [Blastocatellia bacterium]|nr:M28 family peptidase [Blastocatellia bacterium]